MAVNTLNRAQSHIQQLISSDNQDERQLDSYYTAAMSVINAHLNEFFNQYADETGLTLSQVSQQASAWDLNQLEEAITTLTNNMVIDSNLNRELMAARLKANKDSHSTLNAIVDASFAIAAAKTSNYSAKQLPKQYVNEYNHRSEQNADSIPDDVDKNNTEFDNRQQSYIKTAANRVNNTLDKNLRRGIDKQQLNKMTNTVTTFQKQGGIDNLSSVSNKMVNMVKQSFRISAIANTSKGQSDAYDDNGVEYVMWVTQDDDKVCDICAPLDGQIFKVGDAPDPQSDTHYNCRCQLQACDKDGNLLPTY